MRDFSWTRLIATLVLAGLVLGLAARLRGPEYDEGYTAFVTGTAPRPVWPAVPFRAGDVRAAFLPAPSPWHIAANLRRTDVHPPLYFWTIWAWRRLWGPDLWISRLLSVLLSLAALGLLAALARQARFPVVPSLLITLGSYGFVETGMVMRGFALAQCLMLGGLLLVLRAGQAKGRSAWVAGLLLGAASVSNYLTAFTAVAALLWLATRSRRRAIGLCLGLLPFVTVDLFFFLAQRNSRIGQFPPFSLDGMAAALAHAMGGALLGGLPLYLPAGAWRELLTVLLGVILVTLLVLPVLVWRRRSEPAASNLLAMAAIAPILGLCLMGWAANSVPVEIRYLCFAIPPFALLLADAACRLWRYPRVLFLSVLAIVQSLAIAGLLTRAGTMQPEGAAAHAAWRQAGPNGLVLLPRGNDGVGVVAAFLTAAPDDLRILLVTRGETPAALASALAPGHWPCVTAALIGVDQDSRAVLPLLAPFGHHACQSR